MTLDTLRADHLGCYGYVRDTSPFLDRMAAEGARFTRAIATSSHTAPTHASILTGLFPLQHRVLENGQRLRDEFTSLAECFDSRGWDTAAFTSVTFLKGLDAGFDHFSTDDALTSRAGPVLERCRTWIEERGERSYDRPLFLWLHLYDVHMPFLAEDTDYARQLHEEMLEGVGEMAAYLRDELGTPVEFFLDPADAEVPKDERRAQAELLMVQTNNGYDAEIRYVDGELERLYRWMDEKGLNDNTLWVFVADHGEGLGEHDLLNHDRNIYQEQLHIPLILHDTSGRVPVTVEDALVRQVDLMPTILELADFPVARDSEAPGRSLLPLLHGKVETVTPHAFSQRRDPPRGWEPGVVYSLQTSKMKLIHRENGVDELYDLENDPFETENLADQDSPTLRTMRRAMSTLVEGWEEAAALEPLTDGDGHVEELEALGYMGD